MPAFTPDQKIAILVVPMLLFGMLGVSYVSAAGRSFTYDEESTLKRVHTFHSSDDSARAVDSPLRIAIENQDYGAFVVALHNTPFYESATRPVFDTLVRMYMLHTEGRHVAADEHLHDALYKNT